MSTLFAATHPQRTLSLVLMGAFPRMMRAPDYPIGLSDDDFRKRLVSLEEDDWVSAVTKEWLERVGSDILHDPATLRWYTPHVLRSASPGANKAIRLMNEKIDSRDVLPTVSVPTLVLCRAEEYFREASRFIGEHIPGARVAELPGNDHLPWEGDQEAVLDEIERFLSVVREDVEPDRVLATLLFTHLVGSTAKAAGLGDRAWQDLLTRRHRLVRAQLPRFRGREVDTVGDGVFGTFDGQVRAVRCASAIANGPKALGLDVRGVHTGEIEQTNGTCRRRSPHRRANRRGRPSGRGARVEHRQGHRRRFGHRLRGALRARAGRRAGHLAPLHCPDLIRSRAPPSLTAFERASRHPQPRPAAVGRGPS